MTHVIYDWPKSDCKSYGDSQTNTFLPCIIQARNDVKESSISQVATGGKCCNRGFYYFCLNCLSSAKPFLSERDEQFIAKLAGKANAGPTGNPGLEMEGTVTK